MKCSFCGINAKEANRMVEGKNQKLICGDCIQKLKEILQIHRNTNNKEKIVRIA